MTSYNLEIAHADMVRRLSKPGAQMLTDLSPEAMHLLEMTTRICIGAGAIAEAVNSCAFDLKKIDVPKVREALGDLEFGLCGLREPLAIARSETLEANLSKHRAFDLPGYKLDFRDIPAPKPANHPFVTPHKNDFGDDVI